MLFHSMAHVTSEGKREDTYCSFQVNDGSRELSFGRIQLFIASPVQYALISEGLVV